MREHTLPSTPHSGSSTLLLISPHCPPLRLQARFALPGLEPANSLVLHPDLSPCFSLHPALLPRRVTVIFLVLLVYSAVTAACYYDDKHCYRNRHCNVVCRFNQIPKAFYSEIVRIPRVTFSLALPFVRLKGSTRSGNEVCSGIVLKPRNSTGNVTLDSNANEFEARDRERKTGCISTLGYPRD